MMQIDVVTIFPDMVEAMLGFSILKRARDTGRLDVRVAGLRVLVPVGTDPRYLAQVAVALRDTAAC